MTDEHYRYVVMAAATVLIYGVVILRFWTARKESGNPKVDLILGSYPRNPRRQLVKLDPARTKEKFVNSLTQVSSNQGWRQTDRDFNKPSFTATMTWCGHVINNSSVSNRYSTSSDPNFARTTMILNAEFIETHEGTFMQWSYSHDIVSVENPKIHFDDNIPAEKFCNETNLAILKDFGLV